jgi:hypothetical protein
MPLEERRILKYTGGGYNPGGGVGYRTTQGGYTAQIRGLIKHETACLVCGQQDEKILLKERPVEEEIGK